VASGEQPPPNFVQPSATTGSFLSDFFERVTSPRRRHGSVTKEAPMTDAYARYTRLKFDRPHPKVLRITMENGRMNTTDAAMHSELADIWRDIDKDASVNAAILTGAGKVFSS